MELGATVGVIRAMDADIGENAEMDYRIIRSDGPGMFDIGTNRSTQEGVIVLRKVRDSLWGVDEGCNGTMMSAALGKRGQVSIIQHYLIHNQNTQLSVWRLCLSDFNK